MFAATFTPESTQCPAMIDGISHAINWSVVPPMFHNGEEVAPSHRRGFCWNCDERFMD